LRIVVRASDPGAAREAQARLAAAGLAATALADPNRPAPNGEDIAILPARDMEGAARLAEASTDAPPPLARLAGLATDAPPALGLATLWPLSGALALDAPPKLLAGQFEAWRRLTIAEEERTRRAATAAALKAPMPRAFEAGALKALYIGAPNAMFLALERALAEQGALVAAAFSSYAGFDRLHDEPFDAVVLNGVQDASTAIALCAALRRNTTFYHLPTMVVTTPGDAATQAAVIDRGACAVAEANAPCGPSLGWLFEAVRRERRRRAAEHEMRALRDLMGDPRTGLWLRAPFDAHLARLAADHHASGRRLSLAVLRVMPAHGASQPAAETWQRRFSEISSLAARLVREADCGAALGGDILAIALPCSRLKGARSTAERIASVGECTAFAPSEDDASPLVFEQSAVELQPGESGRAMLARALRAIEVESIPA